MCVRTQLLSRVQLFTTPWTATSQVPLSMGFSSQEYWSGLPCPPPGDLPNPGIKPASLTSPALAGGFFTTSATWNGRGTKPSESHRWDFCWPMRERCSLCQWPGAGSQGSHTVTGATRKPTWRAGERQSPEYSPGAPRSSSVRGSSNPKMLTHKGQSMPPHG